VKLSQGTVKALTTWLGTRTALTPDSPLFIGFKFTAPGSPLSSNGIYQIVQRYFEQVTSKRMSPHRIRHSAITAALDSTNGDVRSVQKLSRHSKIETLLIYDDNRTNPQGELSNSLSDLLG
jgi:integrase/recombinase XerC